MAGSLSRFILKTLGWKITGRYPYELKKFIVAVVPHTSNIDFPLGLLVRSALETKIYFVGKKELFRPPFGAIFRALGGYPVDRTKRSNFVQAVADIFDEREEFALCFAPEGTRKRVDQLKSGFYYIAKLANVPIVLTKFDYEHKEVHFGEPFYPTDDAEADMQYIWNYFKGVRGKKPEYGIL